MSETNSVSPLLRQRAMIEDMAARKLNPHTQRSHVYSCKPGSPPGSSARPIRQCPTRCGDFQLYLIESGASICKLRNRIATGVGFLFRRSRCVSPRSGGRGLAHQAGAAEAAASAEP